VREDRNRDFPQRQAGSARVVPIQRGCVSRRIGLAKGEFKVPDDIDAHNAEVAALFLGGR
jgi:hypothetical protein